MTIPLPIVGHLATFPIQTTFGIAVAAERRKQAQVRNRPQQFLFAPFAVHSRASVVIEQLEETHLIRIRTLFRTALRVADIVIRIRFFSGCCSSSRGCSRGCSCCCSGRCRWFDKVVILHQLINGTVPFRIAKAWIIGQPAVLVPFD